MATTGEITVRISELPEMLGIVKAALRVVKARNALHEVDNPLLEAHITGLEVALRRLREIASVDLRYEIDAYLSGGGDEVSGVVS